MKAFLFGLLFLVLVGVGGFLYLKYTSGKSATSQNFQTAAITRTGVLKKAMVAGADFSHIIVSGSDSWGVTSYSIDLDQYVGKTVAATGQNSGTTLYVDSIKVVQ